MPLGKFFSLPPAKPEAFSWLSSSEIISEAVLGHSCWWHIWCRRNHKRILLLLNLLFCHLWWCHLKNLLWFKISMSWVGKINTSELGKGKLPLTYPPVWIRSEFVLQLRRPLSFSTIFFVFLIRSVAVHFHMPVSEQLNYVCKGKMIKFWLPAVTFTAELAIIQYGEWPVQARGDPSGKTISHWGRVFPGRSFTCLEEASLSSDDLFWVSYLCTMFLHQQWPGLHLYWLLSSRPQENHLSTCTDYDVYCYSGEEKKGLSWCKTFSSDLRLWYSCNSLL